MTMGARDFLPENELERLLLDAARDPKARPLLNQGLLSSTLYVLGRPKEKGPTDSSGGTLTDMYLFGIVVDSSKMIPVFTSERRISEFIKTDQPYIGMLGRDLIAMVKHGVGIVVNPASACGREILPDEMRRLLEETVC